MKLNKPTVDTNDNDMIAGDDDNEEEAGQHFTEEEERAADIWGYSSEEEEGAAEIPLGPPFLTNFRYTVKSLDSKTQ